MEKQWDTRTKSLGEKTKFQIRFQVLISSSLSERENVLKPYRTYIDHLKNDKMLSFNEKRKENQRLFLGVHYYRVTFYSKNVLIHVHKDFPFIKQIGP